MTGSAAAVTQLFAVLPNGSTIPQVGKITIAKRKPSKPPVTIRYPHGIRTTEASAPREPITLLLVLGALAGAVTVSAVRMLAGIAASAASTTKTEASASIARALASLSEPGARHAEVLGPVVRAVADGVLERVYESALTPERVVSTADGEIAFYFVGSARTAGGAHVRYGTVICDSDGAITALYEDRVSGETRAWEVPTGGLDEALGIIGGFVGG
jgi:hypothetical protein